MTTESLPALVLRGPGGALAATLPTVQCPTSTETSDTHQRVEQRLELQEPPLTRPRRAFTPLGWAVVFGGLAPIRAVSPFGLLAAMDATVPRADHAVAGPDMTRRTFIGLELAARSARAAGVIAADESPEQGRL